MLVEYADIGVLYGLKSIHDFKSYTKPDCDSNLGISRNGIFA